MPADGDAPSPAAGTDRQLTGRAGLRVELAQRLLEIVEDRRGVDVAVGGHEAPRGALAAEPEDLLETGEEVALGEADQGEADQVLARGPPADQLWGERQAGHGRRDRLVEIGGRGVGGVGLEAVGEERQLLVEGHDRPELAAVPLVGGRQAERFGGLGEDAGADHGRLAVLGDRQALVVALEPGGALVDAGGQGHAPAQLGRPGHRYQRGAAVDGDRVAPAGVDEEVAVVEAQFRLHGAVDRDGRPRPQLDLGVVGQVEDGGAVDDPYLVAGHERAAVGDPDEGRTPHRHLDEARGLEAGGALLHVLAVDVVDGGHDEAGHHHGDDGARQRGDDGAVQGAHVTRPPAPTRCPGPRR